MTPNNKSLNEKQENEQLEERLRNIAERNQSLDQALKKILDAAKAIKTHNNKKEDSN